MADPKSRDEDRTFDPSTPETNRSIDQGNGVGARELDRQASPTERAEQDTQDLPMPAGQNDLA